MKTDKVYVYMCKSPIPDSALEGVNGVLAVIRRDAERGLVSRVLARMLYILFMEK